MNEDIFDNIEEHLTRLYTIKQELNMLNKEEKKLRQRMHSYMNHELTNSIQTDTFICTRDIRAREIVTKDDLPEEVWEMYNRVIEYPVLHIHRL